jgi:hypothetical protein
LSTQPKDGALLQNNQNSEDYQILDQEPNSKSESGNEFMQFPPEPGSADKGGSKSKEVKF